jgi:hypothetical protein
LIFLIQIIVKIPLVFIFTLREVNVLPWLGVYFVQWNKMLVSNSKMSLTVWKPRV